MWPRPKRGLWKTSCLFSDSKSIEVPPDGRKKRWMLRFLYLNNCKLYLLHLNSLDRVGLVVRVPLKQRNNVVAQKSCCRELWGMAWTHQTQWRCTDSSLCMWSERFKNYEKNYQQNNSLAEELNNTSLDNQPINVGCVCVWVQHLWSKIKTTLPSWTEGRA